MLSFECNASLSCQDEWLGVGYQCDF